MRSGRIVQCVRILVTLGLAAFLISLVDFQRVIVLISASNPVLLIAALAVAAVDRLFMIAKWYPLLRVQLGAVPFVRVSKAYLASGVAHYLLPGSIGADLLRAVALGRGGAVVEVGASIAAERIMGLTASAAMSVLALMVAVHHGVALTFILPWAVGSLILGCAAMVVPMHRSAAERIASWTGPRGGSRWFGLAQRLGRAYASYARHSRMLVIVGLLTLIEQGFPIAIVWLSALALGLPVTIGMLLVAVPLMVFAVRIPVSLAGLGVGEGALIYLLGLYGIPPSDALALGALSRLIEFVVNAVPGILLWRTLLEVRREKHTASEQTASARLPDPVHPPLRA